MLNTIKNVLSKLKSSTELKAATERSNYLGELLAKAMEEVEKRTGLSKNTKILYENNKWHIKESILPKNSKHDEFRIRDTINTVFSTTNKNDNTTEKKFVSPCFNQVPSKINNGNPIQIINKNEPMRFVINTKKKNIKEKINLTESVKISKTILKIINSVNKRIGKTIKILTIYQKVKPLPELIQKRSKSTSVLSPKEGSLKPFSVFSVKKKELTEYKSLRAKNNLPNEITEEVPKGYETLKAFLVL